ncbi:MAG: hypothetical protein KJ587_19810 [Alphaproteobacteria bacterium]|nr:hypothetical protein [Alphaproteobacteria bacterium]
MAEWKCKCGQSWSGTKDGWQQATGHTAKKKHTLAGLVDEDGNLLAKDFDSAKSKGLFEEPEDKEKGKKEALTPEITTEGLIRYTIVVPSVAFTYFDLVRLWGLEDSGISFDEWVFKMIDQGMALYYKKQLIFAPVTVTEVQ